MDAKGGTRYGDEEPGYDHMGAYPGGSSRYPGRGVGYRGEVPPAGGAGGSGYPAHGRNTFHQPPGVRAPYHNPNYLGKPRNNKYYQHQMQLGMPPDMGYPDGEYADGPPYHFMASGRFNPGGGYRYGKFHGEYAHHPGGYVIMASFC